MKWLFLYLSIVGIAAVTSLTYFIIEINKLNASQRPSAVELEFITADKEKMICRLDKAIVGKRVLMNKAIWHFNDKDETILDRPWAFRRQGEVAVYVLVYSKKPDGIVLSGSMEVDFKEEGGEMKFSNIINKSLEIVKEYK
jgi:hypothetical protein